MLKTETRAEVADRLAISAILKHERDFKAKCEQQFAASKLLGSGAIEHVTMWTDPHGRPKYDTRYEVPS